MLVRSIVKAIIVALVLATGGGVASPVVLEPANGVAWKEIRVT
jgi:hypothetical protein